MKITNLLEATVASMPEPGQVSFRSGRSETSLEEMTAGCVASVPMPMGKMIKRESGIIKGIKKKMVDEAEISENDLIIMPGQMSKRPTGFTSKDRNEMERIEMAKSDVVQSVKSAKTIFNILKTSDDEIEGWVQEKLAKAEDYLNTVREYLEGKSMPNEAQSASVRMQKALQREKEKREYSERYAEKHFPIGKKPEPINKEKDVKEEWSQKYKSSINCSHPKGFSQKAHCAGKKKHNESVKSHVMEMTCEDCGMCQTHGDNSRDTLDEACWKGYHKEGNKKMFGKTYPNCVKNEGVAEGSEEDSYSNKFVQSQIDYYKKHLLSGNTGDQHRIRGSLMNYERIKNQRIKNNTWQEQGVAEEKKPDFMKAGNMKPFKASGEEIPGAVHALEKSLLKAKEQGIKLNYTNIDKLMQAVCKKHNLTGDELHNEFVDKHHMIPDNWIVKQLDEACWSTHKQVGMKNKGGKQVPNCVPKESIEEEKCPHCSGPMFSEMIMNEKKDACYYKVKSRYSVWPSAYASGALVKCRNKGAANWGNGGKKKNESLEEITNQLEESLHDWFNKEKWVRMDTKGNIKGPCAREPGEGKPKCLPQSKAHNLGKKGRASAAQRKRREDPNPERHGSAINVNTKKNSNESVTESKERCMQCGMKDCKCPGDSCKCKPIAGWIPNKGFKKAMEEGEKVDRMIGHVKSSEKKLGHSDKEAENIAYATANKRGMLNNKNKK